MKLPTLSVATGSGAVHHPCAMSALPPVIYPPYCLCYSRPYGPDCHHLPPLHHDPCTVFQPFRPHCSQPGNCQMKVRRDRLFEDSYAEIMRQTASDLKKRLMIKFDGEDGLDYGGVSRWVSSP